MPYSYQVTNVETEIFNDADVDAVPVVLVPRLVNENNNEHLARVKMILSALNFETQGSAKPV